MRLTLVYSMYLSVFFNVFFHQKKLTIWRDDWTNSICYWSIMNLPALQVKENFWCLRIVAINRLHSEDEYHCMIPETKPLQSMKNRAGFKTWINLYWSLLGDQMMKTLRAGLWANFDPDEVDLEIATQYSHRSSTQMHVPDWKKSQENSRR